MGDWKAVSTTKRDQTRWELFDLSNDISEEKNLADQHAEILEKLKAYAMEAHEDVRPGTFISRDRHEQDREAKWGDMPRPKKN